MLKTDEKGFNASREERKKTEREERKDETRCEPSATESYGRHQNRGLNILTESLNHPLKCQSVWTVTCPSVDTLLECLILGSPEVTYHGGRQQAQDFLADASEKRVFDDVTRVVEVAFLVHN
jgi:hypothetical protein